MRVASVAEAIARATPADAARLLADLIAGACDATSGHRAALDAALEVLADPARLTYVFRAELYAAAREAELPEVALLLLDAAPKTRGTESLERHLDDERPLVPTGRPLTLGERKSLARGHRRDVLLHLLRDPHPDVVTVLLENPHLTEADVLRIAARRPVLADTLEAVAASRRWRARQALRRAIVFNPYARLPLAARLMAMMSDRELEEAARDVSLADALQRHAADLLRRRRARWVKAS